MYNPLVTIVIPVYCGADFVGKAIESALNQTYKNIEILVINDGSNDNDATKNAALPYINKIRYIEKANGGVSTVLNMAFKEMKGEWLSWLSHDDLYYPDKVKRQIDFINQNSITDYEKTIIFSDFDFNDENGNEIKLPTKSNIKVGMTNKEIILVNIKRNSMGGCTFLIPKFAYSDIGGFAENIRTISDFDYWYRLLFQGYKFYYIDEILTTNRMHSKQVTYVQSEKSIKESNDFYQYVLQQMAFNKNDFNSKDFLRAGYYLSRRNQKLASNKAFELALQYDNSALNKIKMFFVKDAASLICIIRNSLKKYYVQHKLFKNK